jgi:hypothetical protein
MRWTLAFRFSTRLGTRHGREAAGNDRDQPRDRIPPDADLLAGVEAAGLIGNRHFQRYAAGANQLSKQLEIEIESIAPQSQAF